MAKSRKLTASKQEALQGTIDKKVQLREFDKDIVKHYIREYHWKKHIDKLIRARDDIRKINFFSLCADTAYDVRLFKKHNLIDFENRRIPFAYCESNKKYFEILEDDFNYEGQGFFGKLEDIATDVTNEYYGKFWGTFPFDVINLDFWGDIHRGDEPTNNIFYAIQSILMQQSNLGKQYELWITWRVKSDRIAQNVKQAYKQLIKHNYKNDEFKKLIDPKLSNPNNPLSLNNEQMINIGFIKWLLYASNRSFSVINPDETEILFYTRKDKYNKEYKIYNFLLRINPYEHVEIPSPACPAAIHCEEEYTNNLVLCFREPIDIDREFKSLARGGKDKLKSELKELQKDYSDRRKGSLR